MQSNLNPNPVKPAGVGCSPFMLMLIGAFSFFPLSASITPITNLIARYTLCPGAPAAYIQTSSGGIVEKLGVAIDLSGRIITLYCSYEDGRVEKYENDVVAMSGFGVSVGFGALAGLITYFVLYIRSTATAAPS